MTDESTNTIVPVTNERSRWPLFLVWLGFVIMVAGALSYFLYFVQFADLRDFPVLNLPIVILGVLVAGVGCGRVFRQKRGMLSKGLAGIGFLLTLSLAGLFNVYIFSMSCDLPKSSDAPATDGAAPDFTLRDHNNQAVTLSDFRGEKVVVVFYRGFW